MSHLSRRNMLKLAGLAAGSQALGLRSFAALPALAQSTSASDYKALVCIFLMGGNDGNNLIIPADAQGFDTYQKIRGSVALPSSSLLSLGGSSPVLLNAAMPNLQSFYKAGTAAFVANVGPLVQNVTRAQFQSGSTPVPFNLFSHRDQQIGWQSANPGISSTVGWAGLAADTLKNSGSGTLPKVISVSGNPVFLYGNETTGLSIAPTATQFSVDCGQGSLCGTRLHAAQQLLAIDNNATLIQADSNIGSNSYEYFSELSNAVAYAPTLKTSFPQSNSLAVQLQQIAKIMSVRSSLGTNRQIFIATLGSFDTHSDQLKGHTALLSQLDTAIATFQQAMVELGLQEQVTTFTMSDFGRAMVPNSLGGTDHAWGSHHFVVGGAVKGGGVYGSMPQLVLGGPDDATNDGRWIPSTSASQYTATLASWFGIAPADMPKVVPNIGNFSNQNLGFI